MTARPERVAAEEVRQRMLSAGRELALEAGAALTIEHLRLEEVIQRARVPRSSVYRMWPYREDYIDDLLATLGSTRSGDARRRIAAALEDSQLRSRESIVTILRTLTAVLGLRLRDPAYTLDHVQLAGGLLVQAMAMRNIQVRAVLAPDGGAAPPGGGGAGEGDADDGDLELSEPRYVNDLLNAPIPGPGLNGQPAEWTLVAYAYLGQLDAFLEPDPDFTPPAG